MLVRNPSNQAEKLDWKLDYLLGFDGLLAGRVSWGLKEETHNRSTEVGFLELGTLCLTARAVGLGGGIRDVGHNLLFNYCCTAPRLPDPIGPWVQAQWQGPITLKFCLKPPSQTTSFEPQLLTDARYKFPEQVRKSRPDIP